MDVNLMNQHLASTIEKAGDGNALPPEVPGGHEVPNGLIRKEVFVAYVPCCLIKLQKDWKFYHET